MIRIRHAHPAFGRGGIQFLEPANRAVLAYVRVDGEEAILCVNNLSSEPQTAELDLGAWAGAEVVDLFSGRVVGHVTGGALWLDLRRYQYFWLQLG